MAETMQPLDINTLHNVNVVEELIQLIVKSDAEVIANSHWSKDLAKDFFLEYFQGCCIIANRMHAPAHCRLSYKQGLGYSFAY